VLVAVAEGGAGVERRGGWSGYMVKHTIFHCVFILLISDLSFVLFIHSFYVYYIIFGFYFQQAPQQQANNLIVGIVKI